MSNSVNISGTRHVAPHRPGRTVRGMTEHRTSQSVLADHVRRLVAIRGSDPPEQHVELTDSEVRIRYRAVRIDAAMPDPQQDDAPAARPSR